MQLERHARTGDRRGEIIEAPNIDQPLLDEFWREWCLNRLKDDLTEHVQREQAQKGYYEIANFNPHDGLSWLRLGLAL